MEKLAVLHKSLRTEAEDEWDADVFRKNVEEFFQALRKNFGNNINYFNKLHILEKHFADMIDSHGVLGSYSEQASEALHYLFEERMKNFKNKQTSSDKSVFEINNLKYAMKIQYELVYLNDCGLLY